ncbi:MAG: DUF929 family protein [Acidimicrobiales bacterium]|jgi:hypothetical protein
MSDTGPNRSARLAWGAVVAILLGAVVLVTYALTHVSTTATVVEPAVTAPGILDAVSTVPASIFDGVGVTVPDTDLTPPRAVSGPPLTADGKPEVLFIGAEYGPFCAAERWPLIVALSRFGHFTVLRDATSADQSVFPGTATFSFDDAEYTSPYLTFTGVELYSDQIGADGTFTRIAKLTAAQSALVARYASTGTSPATGASPFVDIAGRMVTTTSGFSPALLAGQSQAQIASELDGPPVTTDPASGTTSTPPTGQAIIAAANELSVGICAATGQEPSSVCLSKGIRSAAQALATSPSATPVD